MAGAIMDKVWGLFGGVDQGDTALLCFPGRTPIRCSGG